MFSETGGLEMGAPDEGAGGSEQASEQAQERFAASQAAAKQAAKDERKAKKRDDGVARMILQFLTDNQRTHLATLISRLVSRDCPSIFLLAILSLINPDCRQVVLDYLKERADQPEEVQDLSVAPGTEIAGGDPEFVPWIDRIQQVLRYEHHPVLKALMIDAQNIDGTVLQLTSFVIQEFLQGQGKEAAFERIQNLTVSILQSTFQPYLEVLQQHMLEQEAAAKAKEEED